MQLIRSKLLIGLFSFRTNISLRSQGFDLLLLLCYYYLTFIIIMFKDVIECLLFIHACVRCCTGLIFTAVLHTSDPFATFLVM